MKAREYNINKFGMQLVTPHLIRRLSVPGLQSSCRQAVKIVWSDDIIQHPVDKSILITNKHEETLEDETKPA